jgi:hypothetical protein
MVKRPTFDSTQLTRRAEELIVLHPTAIGLRYRWRTAPNAAAMKILTIWTTIK